MAREKIQMFLKVLIVFISLPLVARGDFTEHLKKPFTDPFDKTGLVILSVGTIATTIAFSLDSQIHDNWKGHQRMSESTADIGDFWGQGWVPGALLGVQIGVDPEKGVPSTEGVLSSTAVVMALKFVTKRNRPDSETKTSFPSGHTQLAFSYATTVMMSYGWEVSTPAYAMAVLTGLSRLADNAHWFSDVVAGATVGILFGRGTFQHHFSVVPVSYDGFKGGGIIATMRY